VPIYEYDCECGLRFEKMRPISEFDATQACPECGLDARKLVSAVNHTFAHTPVGGPRPQNTGVHAIDYNADRVIGRDAESKWKGIEARQKHKTGVLRDAAKQGIGAGMDHLVRSRGAAEGAGDYRVVTEPERQVINARREVVTQVTKASKKTPAGE